MKKLLSLALSFLLTFGCCACLATAPVGAAETESLAENLFFEDYEDFAEESIQLTKTTAYPANGEWGLGRNSGFDAGPVLPGTYYLNNGTAYTVAGEGGTVTTVGDTGGSITVENTGDAAHGKAVHIKDNTGLFWLLGLTVRPNTKYTLSFEIKGTAGQALNAIRLLSTIAFTSLDIPTYAPILGLDPSITYNIHSFASSAKIRLCEGLANQSLTGAWQTLKFTFTTPSHLNSAYVYFDNMNKPVTDLLVDNLKLQAEVKGIDTPVEFVDENGSPYAKNTANIFAKTTVLPASGGYSANIAFDNTSGGYAFEGWFSQNGTLLSTALNATLLQAPATARIKVLNLFSSASFEGESQSLNVASNTEFPQKELWGSNKNAGYYGATYAETVYDKNGKAYSQIASGSPESVGSGAAVKICSTAAHTGEKSAEITFGYRTAVMGFTVEKNKKYILSYYYKTKPQRALALSGIFTTVNLGQGDAVGKNSLANCAESFTLSLNKTVEQNTSGEWSKVTHIFESGDFEKLYLGIHPNGYDIGKPTSYDSGPIYIDDLCLTEYRQASVKITDMKSCAAVVGVNGTDLEKIAGGQLVQFKVITNKNTIPTVLVNGNPLSANNSGVYSFTAEPENSLSVRFAGDEALNDWNKDYNGVLLDRYNAKAYLTPIWQGNTVYQEPALFVPQRDVIKLLYPVSKAVSVRNYALNVNYVEGVDYEITPKGELKRLAGSRIPQYTAPLTSETPLPNLEPYQFSDGSHIQPIGDAQYAEYAVSVTYEHTQGWDGVDYAAAAATSQASKLNKTIEKLENGEEVNILFFGDSISCGWSSSGLKNYVDNIANNGKGIYGDDNKTPVTHYNYAAAPYAPTWMEMFITTLKEQYPNAAIKTHNLALGGKDSNWGKISLAERMKLLNGFTPDLMILSFACNDITGGMTAERFKENMQQIINVLRNPATTGGNPNAEVLFWSQSLPNTRIAKFTPEIFLAYEAKQEELVNENTGVGIAKITTLYREIIKTKDALDYLNTYLNHGNDFTARNYATSVLTAITKAEQPNIPALEGGENATFTFVGNSIRKDFESANGQALRFKYTVLNSAFAAQHFSGYTLTEYGFVVQKKLALNGSPLTKSNALACAVGYRATADGTVLEELVSDYNEKTQTKTFTAALYNIGYYTNKNTTNYALWGCEYTIRCYAVYSKTGAADIVRYGLEHSSSVFATFEAIEKAPASQSDLDYLTQKLAFAAPGENGKTIGDYYAAWKNKKYGF